MFNAMPSAELLAAIFASSRLTEAAQSPTTINTLMSVVAGTVFTLGWWLVIASFVCTRSVAFVKTGQRLLLDNSIVRGVAEPVDVVANTSARRVLSVATTTSVFVFPTIE